MKVTTFLASLLASSLVISCSHGSGGSNDQPSSPSNVPSPVKNDVPTTLPSVNPTSPPHLTDFILGQWSAVNLGTQSFSIEFASPNQSSIRFVSTQDNCELIASGHFAVSPNQVWLSDFVIQGNPFSMINIADANAPSQIACKQWLGRFFTQTALKLDPETNHLLSQGIQEQPVRIQQMTRVNPQQAQPVKHWPPDNQFIITKYTEVCEKIFDNLYRGSKQAAYGSRLEFDNVPGAPYATYTYFSTQELPALIRSVLPTDAHPTMYKENSGINTLLFLFHYGTDQNLTYWTCENRRLKWGGMLPVRPPSDMIKNN